MRTVGTYSYMLLLRSSLGNDMLVAAGGGNFEVDIYDCGTGVFTPLRWH